MESERSVTVSEYTEEKINLSKITFEFCDSTLIDGKVDEFRDKDTWITTNREKLQENQSEVEDAVRRGVLRDAKAETVWEFLRNKRTRECGLVRDVKEKLQQQVELIRDQVVHRLTNFLPEWVAPSTTVFFTIDERSDFRVNNGVVTADLWRIGLCGEQYLEHVVEGLTHEIFHVWMSENDEWSDAHADKATDEELKTHILRRTIDEGLAVLISGQSLRDFHERQRRNYDQYVSESFALFDTFVKETNRSQLEQIYAKEFKNMGRLYVAGYEMVSEVLREQGPKQFRQILVKAKSNPQIIVDAYMDILTSRSLVLVH